MGLERVIHNEMLSVNRGIIKRRKNIQILLSEPYLERDETRVKVDENCLKKIEKEITLPLSMVFLPVSFFLPAGLDEGYLTDENDVRVAEIFGIKATTRDKRWWFKKNQVRRLVSEHPNCFQIIVVP